MIRLTDYSDFILVSVLFQFNFPKEEKCVKTCTKTYTEGDAESTKKLEFLKKGISENYQHHWYIILFVLLSIYIYYYKREL